VARLGAPAAKPPTPSDRPRTAPSGERLEWKVVIWFPWDPELRLFRGEKVYVSGIDLAPVAA
jgi:hypothetical protein